MPIAENVKKILGELPQGVELVAVAKNRTPEEVMEAVEAGVRIIGENHVQEAERHFPVIRNRVKWHFVGHLQRNKVKKAVELFDMIETVDSLELAQEIDKRSRQINKVMPVLIEVNSGREPQKSGVLPEEVEGLIRVISELSNVKVMGLMTMGPLYDNPEKIRPYLAATKALFEHLKCFNIINVELKYLSMGMSASYKIALQEGANIVRVGTRIFEDTC